MANRVRRVDVHSYVLPHEMLAAIRSRPRDYQMRVERCDGGEIFIRDDRHSTPVYAECHDADALRFLVAKAGADRVTIGTDAPYDMGEEDPVAMVNALPGLTDEQRDRILGLNALELLGEA